MNRLQQLIHASLLSALTITYAHAGEPQIAPPSKAKKGVIALVQYTSDVNFNSTQEDDLRKAIQLNRSNLTALLNKSVENGANIVVFPEGSSLGYQRHASADVTDFDRQITWCAKDQEELVMRFTRDVTCVDISPFAQRELGEETNYWANLSKKHGIYLVVPTIERLTENYGTIRYANTAKIFGPSGYLFSHRKTSRWVNEDFLNTVVGTETRALETPYGKFGIIICNGIFPKGIAESYLAQNVNGILFPSDWVEKSYNGYAGSADNSFDFLSRWKGLNLFSADDARASSSKQKTFKKHLLGSGRTGFFSKNESVASIKMPDNSGQDGILLLNIDFTQPEGQQVSLQKRVTASFENDNSIRLNGFTDFTK